MSKQHWKQLNNIRYSLYRMERPSLSPRFSAALLVAIATALVAGMVLLWGAYTACLIGAAVGIAVYQFAPLSKSWAETLDNQLTAYDPVDVEAYAELQDVTRSLGRLDLGEVFRWHCCKVSDEAAFCLIQRPYISKTLLTRRISP
ncbi:hypothetical protein LNX29_25775, partial [Klebsiella pneumoniae]|nr:hypothetical protein [Klebsiella pneumoniae]